MAVFMWIERVHEDTSVDGVPQMSDGSPAKRTACGTSGNGHLASHLRQEAHAAHARTKLPFEAPARAQERVPSYACGRILCGGRVFGRVERKNDTDGRSSMGQDVGGSRVSHLTDDPGRMSLQFSHADHSLRLPRPTAAWPEVVPHVTTLRSPLSARQSRL
jgi:hypothetical protein